MQKTNILQPYIAKLKRLEQLAFKDNPGQNCWDSSIYFLIFAPYSRLLQKEKVSPLPTPYSECLIMAILILSYASLIDILDSASRILQCWSYFAGHNKHDTEAAIAIDSCFAIIVLVSMA